MPTYEYACKDCGEHLDVVQSFHDDPLTECPNCGGTLRKVFSAAGIIFKGSGWHIKDYANSGSGGRGGSDDSVSSGTGSDSSGTGSGSTGSKSGSTGSKSGSSGSKSGSSGSGTDGSAATTSATSNGEGSSTSGSGSDSSASAKSA